MVAQQFSSNFLTSLEGIFINTFFCCSSLPTILAYDQAVFINLPFEKGVTSNAKIFIPSGISFNCFLFQALIGESFPDITSSPTTTHFHANTYLFSQSA